MSENVVSSAQLVEKLTQQAKQRVKELQEKVCKTPSLVILMAGNNPASISYVTKKIELAKACGLISEVRYLDENNKTEYDKITTELNNNDEINGFMLQLPCSLDLKNGYNIAINKDVDCLEEETYQNMLDGKEDAFVPCTPLGVMRYLEFLNIDVATSKIAVIGRSRLVGKPLAELLKQAGSEVTVCHSQTKSIKESIKNCDVVISAVGKAGLLNKDNLVKGQVIIDIGTNKVDGKLCGDVALDAKHLAKTITPVPGGVGPLTVMSLITNTIDSCYLANNLKRPTWVV